MQQATGRPTAAGLNDVTSNASCKRHITVRHARLQHRSLPRGRQLSVRRCRTCPIVVFHDPFAADSLRKFDTDETFFAIRQKSDVTTARCPCAVYFIKLPWSKKGEGAMRYMVYTACDSEHRRPPKLLMNRVQLEKQSDLDEGWILLELNCNSCCRHDVLNSHDNTTKTTKDLHAGLGRMRCDRCADLHNSTCRKRSFSGKMAPSNHDDLISFDFCISPF
jgi:hypothetical protein